MRYVGQPVAAVVAETRYAARDALEAMAVDYDPLPVVADALAPAGVEAAAINFYPLTAPRLFALMHGMPP